MARYLDNAGLAAYDTKIKDYLRAEKYEYRNANAAALVAGGATHLNIMNVYAQMRDFDDLTSTYKKFDLVAELTFVKHGDPYSVATAAAKYSVQLQGCNYSSELASVRCISKVYDRIGLKFAPFYPDAYDGLVPIIRVFAPAYSSEFCIYPGAAFDCYIERKYEKAADFTPTDEYSGTFGEMRFRPSPITFGLRNDAVNVLPDDLYSTEGSAL